MNMEAFSKKNIVLDPCLDGKVFEMFSLFNRILVLSAITAALFYSNTIIKKQWRLLIFNSQIA